MAVYYSFHYDNDNWRVQQHVGKTDSVTLLATLRSAPPLSELLRMHI